MSIELLSQDNEVYGDHNSLRIEDLEDRKRWKIVTYTDPCDVRKTCTYSALREAIDKAQPVTTLPRLPSDMIDYVFIKDVTEGLAGEEISIEKIVPLLKRKGIDKEIIKKVDNNLTKTFTDYERKFKK